MSLVNVAVYIAFPILETEYDPDENRKLYGVMISFAIGLII